MSGVENQLLSEESGASLAGGGGGGVVREIINVFLSAGRPCGRGAEAPRFHLLELQECSR